MSPFKPAGSQARWRIAYQLLCSVQTGETLAYDRFGEAMNLDPTTDRHKIQAAVRVAAEHHLEQDKRAIQAVPDEGYRVVNAAGHLVLARQHHSRSGRELERGRDVAVNVDLSDVDPKMRHALEMTAEGLSVLLEYNRRLDARQQRLEEALTSVSVRTERSEAELAELRDRLERLEI